MAEETLPYRRCPWCGDSIASPTKACPDCGRLPDWRAWVDSCHAEADGLAPPGWEGIATDEPLDSTVHVVGYLRRELAALLISGENGRGEFWLERANELYRNIFRALRALRISDCPEQLPTTTDCDEAERRLGQLWQSMDAAASAKLANLQSELAVPEQAGTTSEAADKAVGGNAETQSTNDDRDTWLYSEKKAAKTHAAIRLGCDVSIPNGSSWTATKQ